MATENGPVTEICRITLRPNVDISEESKDFKICSQWGRWTRGRIEPLLTWMERVGREALDTVASQDGFVKSYYGTQFEAKNEVVWCIGLFEFLCFCSCRLWPIERVISSKTLLMHPKRRESNWTSISAHRAFEASSAYQSFKEKLGVIMEDVIFFHINQISKPLLSPAVMEIATFYGTGGVFIHGLEEFKKAIENLKEVPRGYLSWMDWGSSFEMIRRGGDGEKGEGEKGRVVVLMLAWRSMEDHMAFRDTEDFKSVIGHLRKGTTGAEMVSFLRMKPGPVF
ncbi:Dimeric alpha-beta barrel protein [Rutstroemia sp. NJR-2017a BVV2]|nr:Dimeric alpha-beta barrel protein [Rutstroemia sp. NJR-2017a BVV2]